MDLSADAILIVGAGFAGLCMAIRLKQAGIENFTVLEEADEVGGTWRDNIYPGAACDVESDLYSFSFAPSVSFSRSFGSQREILAYLVHCAARFDLRRHIHFRAPVASARFDDQDGTWAVETRGGQTFRARVLVCASGGLRRPAYPDIPGLPGFEGATFHSARWDPGVKLDGQAVAVIGTGASAVQIVPEIAPKVARLDVYQRTAPWIMPKPNPIRGAFAQALFAEVPALHRLARLAVYWRREALAVGFIIDPDIMKIGERLCRDFLARSVPDAELRAKLTPNYRLGCKRILPTSDYYPALMRDNVTLVTDPIARVGSRAIFTMAGAERPVDAIILSTGFQAAENIAPFAITGRSGARLDEVWGCEGAEAYLGSAVSGFPNLFFMVGPNTGLGHNSMVVMIEAQAQYILSAIETIRTRKLKLVDVRSDRQSRYNATLQARLGRTVWATGCRSWYHTRSGKNTTLWPGFTFEFRWKTRRFDPRDYELVFKGDVPHRVRPRVRRALTTSRP